MAIAQATVSVANTAGGTALASNGGGLGDPKQVYINNVGAATLFIGGSGVTVGTGFPILTGANFGPIVLGPGDALFGIVAGANQNVNVIQTRS